MRTKRALLLAAALPALAAIAFALSSSAAAPPPAAETLTLRVRPPALAGGWYPADRPLMEVEIRRMLRAASSAPAIAGRPIAIVVPHAGWKYSGAVAAAAYRNLHRGDFARVVIVAPSHHGAFDGFAIDDAAAYRTPHGDVRLSAEGVATLRDDRLVGKVEGVTEQEHSIEIEIPFLQETLGEFTLVPVLAGRTTPPQERTLAERLARLDDGKTLFVFSSDFTHYGPRYGYMPFGPTSRALPRIREMNDRAIDAILRLDPAAFRTLLEQTGNSICGRVGISVMLEWLSRRADKPTGSLLAHYASGEMQGLNDDSSVSYVAIAFAGGSAAAGRPMLTPPRYAALSPEAPLIGDVDGEHLVRLARATLDTQLSGGDDLSREMDHLSGDPSLERLQGVFVTLNRTDPKEIERLGRLRGCIGQTFPVLPLYEAVVESAFDSALKDPRFPPVQAAELPRLEVEVTALTAPKPVASYHEIRLGTHGIILEKNGHKAVFLPQVPPEQGWNLDQTLDALSLKAGLPRDAWREGATFSVFTGQVFKEKGKERSAS